MRRSSAAAGTDGSPRIYDDFVEWRERVSRKRIIRLMQEDEGLGSLLLSAYHLALGLAAVAVIALTALWLLTLLTSKEDHSERARCTVIFLGYGFEFALWAVIATMLGGLARQLAHQ